MLANLKKVTHLLVHCTFLSLDLSSYSTDKQAFKKKVSNTVLQKTHTFTLHLQ